MLEWSCPWCEGIVAVESVAVLSPRLSCPACRVVVDLGDPVTEAELAPAA